MLQQRQTGLNMFKFLFPISAIDLVADSSHRHQGTDGTLSSTDFECFVICFGDGDFTSWTFFSPFIK